MKKFSSKITVLVSYSVPNKLHFRAVAFVREFPIAAMLNPSLKSCFMYGK